MNSELQRQPGSPARDRSTGTAEESRGLGGAPFTPVHVLRESWNRQAGNDLGNHQNPPWKRSAVPVRCSLRGLKRLFGRRLNLTSGIIQKPSRRGFTLSLLTSVAAEARAALAQHKLPPQQKAASRGAAAQGPLRSSRRRSEARPPALLCSAPFPSRSRLSQGCSPRRALRGHLLSRRHAPRPALPVRGLLAGLARSSRSAAAPSVLPAAGLPDGTSGSRSCGRFHGLTRLWNQPYGDGAPGSREARAASEQAPERRRLEDVVSEPPTASEQPEETPSVPFPLVLPGRTGTSPLLVAWPRETTVCRRRSGGGDPGA